MSIAWDLLTDLAPTIEPESIDYDFYDGCARSDADANVGVYTYHLVGILGMASLCIVGNSIVIFIMIKECKLNTALNCFIVSLACSDLLQGSIYAVYNISHLNVPSVRHALGAWVICCPMLMVVVMTLMSSPYNLVAITVIRYMSVKWPLHHSQMLTKRRTIAAMVTVWLTALGISCGFYIRTEPELWCDLCRSELHWKFYQTTGMLVFAALLPFLVMMSLYISMTKIYHNHVKAMNKAMTNDATTEKTQKREQTLSRVSAFLVGYFFVSYLPFVVYTFIYYFCNCTISGYIRSSVRIVLFSNTTVNFFAYIIAHQEFRRGLFRRFCYSRYLKEKRSLSVSYEYQHTTGKGSLSLNTVSGGTTADPSAVDKVKIEMKEDKKVPAITNTNAI